MYIDKDVHVSDCAFLISAFSRLILAKKVQGLGTSHHSSTLRLLRKRSSKGRQHPEKTPFIIAQELQKSKAPIRVLLCIIARPCDWFRREQHPLRGWSCRACASGARAAQHQMVIRSAISCVFKQEFVPCFDQCKKLGHSKNKAFYR